MTYVSAASGEENSMFVPVAMVLVGCGSAPIP